MRILRKAAMWAVGGIVLAAWSVGSGQGGGGGRLGPTGVDPSAQTVPQAPSTVPPIAPDLGIPPQMEADQAKMRNVERQKQLVDDTQKLLSLANELKADVDKSNKDMLSLDVVRKADEIEKLAHNVKEKMKNGN